MRVAGPVTAGATAGEARIDQETVSGGTIFLSYDKVDWERNSFMFMIGYMDMEDSTDTPDYITDVTDDKGA